MVFIGPALPGRSSSCGLNLFVTLHLLDQAS
jgi:hypothetical protein